MRLASACVRVFTRRRNDVAAGRRYVEAYVPYVHYVERLWETATVPVHDHYVEHEPQPHVSERVAHQH